MLNLLAGNVVSDVSSYDVSFVEVKAVWHGKPSHDCVSVFSAENTRHCILKQHCLK
jgi:hypothetical protein